MDILTVCAWYPVLYDVEQDLQLIPANRGRAPYFVGSLVGADTCRPQAFAAGKHQLLIFPRLPIYEQITRCAVGRWIGFRLSGFARCGLFFTTEKY